MIKNNHLNEQALKSNLTKTIKKAEDRLHHLKLEEMKIRSDISLLHYNLKLLVTEKSVLDIGGISAWHTLMERRTHGG